jgi:hypothetical protein
MFGLYVTCYLLWATWPYPSRQLGYSALLLPWLQHCGDILQYTTNESRTSTVVIFLNTQSVENKASTVLIFNAQVMGTEVALG